MLIDSRATAGLAHPRLKRRSFGEVEKADTFVLKIKVGRIFLKIL
jgi:hypothetical protein